MSFIQIQVVSALFIIFLSSTNGATPEHRYTYCPNTTNFTPNSTYQSNLNVLLSSLVSNSTSESGFYNASVGRDPDAVFGSFLCRGDISPDDCRICITTAANDAVRDRCPKGKIAVLWYAECMLRYWDTNYFGEMYEGPRIAMFNTGNINDPERFTLLLGNVTNEAVTAAAEAPAGAKKFATRDGTFSGMQTLYSLVQCTPDITSSDCNRCLRTLVANLPVCCSGAQGANILTPSCNIRFEVYPFYKNNSTALPPRLQPPLLSPPSLPSPPPTAPIVRREGNRNISPVIVVSISLSIATVLLLMGIGFIWLRRREMKRKKIASLYNAVPNDQNDGNESMTTEESLQYDLETIQNATNNFSDDNKLGEGGFGPVYKGVLSNGQEIAVKRLSSTSLQGVGEFKNEVLLVAKLQHRNLTRLMGFCLEGVEKLLVYEFVPNNSLDKFLFDQPEDQAPLDWVRRYKVIGGIARGILYLHEDSRLRVIHRDLKASNILLDEQLNPKISDFGMAKICGVDQTQGNTSRIVGTFGYMSPEYAFYGQFSVKSDVFSFGVLVIEIVTGKKGTRFLGSDSETEDLLSYTWKQWRDGTALELIDPRIRDSYSANEVVRCIHIGLLCVQESPDDRPTMATIVLMLSSYSVSLPLPKQPAFFPHTRTEGTLPKTDLDSDKSSTKSFTINEMSITETYPR